MDIQAFNSEIQNDPLGRGYANMTDDELWTSLTTANRPQRQRISAPDLAAWVAASDRLIRFRAIEQDTEKPAAVRNRAAAAVMLSQRHDLWLDLNSLQHQGLIALAVQDGTLTAEEQAELYALATVNVSRAEELGCGDMSKDYMIYLRSLL